MKKFLVGGFVFAFCSIAFKSNAQYAVSGVFSSTDNGNGYHTLYCTDRGFCGVLGRDVPGGEHLFTASNGSQWIVYSSTGNPKEELESGAPVIAKPADEEEG